MQYTVTFKTRWSDFDPNNHMRHSAYNDYAAEARVRFFSDRGLSLLEFNRQNIGPVLFSEYTRFYKEIKIGEDITVELVLKGLSESGKKFKFNHRIYNREKQLAAEIEVFGAWLDLAARKVTIPPQNIMDLMNDLEKTEDFEIIERYAN